MKSFIANGKTALKGKANIKQALAAIGLSALAVSASASTSEVAEVAQETLAPRANFKAKAWAQQGAR